MPRRHADTTLRFLIKLKGMIGVLANRPSQTPKATRATAPTIIIDMNEGLDHRSALLEPVKESGTSVRPSPAIRRITPQRSSSIHRNLLTLAASPRLSFVTIKDAGSPFSLIARNSSTNMVISRGKARTGTIMAQMPYPHLQPNVLRMWPAAKLPVKMAMIPPTLSGMAAKRPRFARAVVSAMKTCSVKSNPVSPMESKTLATCRAVSGLYAPSEAYPYDVNLNIWTSRIHDIGHNHEYDRQREALCSTNNLEEMRVGRVSLNVDVLTSSSFATMG